MKKIKYKIVKFMDLFIGPFLTNGNKQDAYFKRMNKKYSKKNEH